MTNAASSADARWDDPGFLARLSADEGPDVSCVVDPTGVVRYTGGAVDRLLGHRRGEQVGASIWEFVHPDDLVAAAGALNEASRSTGYHQPAVFRVRHGVDGWIECEVNGTTFDGPGGAWLIIALRGLHDRDVVMGRRRHIGQIIQSASIECSAVDWTEVDRTVERYLGELAGVVRGISVELAWAESGGELRSHATWNLARGPAFAPDRVPSVRRESRRAAPRPRFVPLWSADELAGSLLRFSSELAELAPSESRDAFIATGAQAAVEIPLAVTSPQAMLRVGFGENCLQWDDVNVDLVVVLASTLMAALRRCSAEEHLRRQASTDGLTGLLNRGELYRLLDHYLADPHATGEIGVLYGDLDHFKEINDRDGHAAGDRLLRDVAEALRTSVRGVDLVARFGGDEFVVVCPELEDEDHLAEVIARVRRAVTALSGPGRPVSMSLGGVLGHAGLNGDDLVRRADELMYADKRSRREVDAATEAEPVGGSSVGSLRI